MSRRRIMTHAQQAYAMAKYRAGESLRRIARVIGTVTHGAIASLVRRRGISRAASSRPVVAAHRAFTIPRTVDRFGISLPFIAWLSPGTPDGAHPTPAPQA